MDSGQFLHPFQEALNCNEIFMVLNDCLPGVVRDSVAAYLTTLYEGVFTQEAIDAHLENHIGFAFANYTIEVIGPRLKKGARVLDIGSGFGSCVLAARNAGFDAIGVEISTFEVEFARDRLRRHRPLDNAVEVYRQGDARSLFLPEETVDAVTLWNVIEHIDNWELVMTAVTRYLKPGGIVFIVCPNYMAWREEAHYHIPWRPSFLLPRKKAIAYLQSRGRNSAFFESSIFYRSNWEVLRKLHELGFASMELGTLEPREFRFSNIPSMLCHPLKYLRFYNPFKHSIELAARKPDRVSL